MKGIVFNVQRYSIHDGPGIRTVIFLKGCPLKCKWCCNPESQRFQKEIEFHASLCTKCGKCIDICPNKAINADLLAVKNKIDYSKCVTCGACTALCSANALRIVGWETCAEEILEIILKDKAAYRRSHGGVTLSGGEPLRQSGFAAEILRGCYENNIHTAIETTGYADWSDFEKVIPYTDLFLFDIKHSDNEKHKELTGVSNRKIIRNLKKLANSSVHIAIRYPLIRNINGTDEDLHYLAHLAMETGIKQIHLMPFHQLGKDKYKHLGRDYSMETEMGLEQTAEGLKYLHLCKEKLEQYDFNVWIGG